MIRRAIALWSPLPIPAAASRRMYWRTSSTRMSPRKPAVPVWVSPSPAKRWRLITAISRLRSELHVGTEMRLRFAHSRPWRSCQHERPSRRPARNKTRERQPYSKRRRSRARSGARSGAASARGGRSGARGGPRCAQCRGRRPGHSGAAPTTGHHHHPGWRRVRRRSAHQRRPRRHQCVAGGQHHDHSHPRRRPARRGRYDMGGVRATLAFIIVGWPIARAFARRMDRRAVTTQLSAEVQTRLDAMERNIDTVAIELERVSEGQRFTNRLLEQRPLEHAQRSDR